MRNLYFSLSFLTSLALVSCSTALNHLPGVYRLEVQQGNIVDQPMVDQLRPNMSKRQVLYIMGSPMVVDVFHQNRWDYIYSDQPSGEDRVQKKISLFFRNDQLSGIQGDFRPGSQPMLKVVNEATVDVPKRDLEKTFWEQITSLFSFSDETKSVKETESVKKDNSDAKPMETESPEKK